uniref:Uncharacterized protein n=1 Tax=Lepeophtheirus salmonis TaxID=72036 RepID=A0A0K2TTE4_LEPSM
MVTSTAVEGEEGWRSIAVWCIQMHSNCIQSA